MRKIEEEMLSAIRHLDGGEMWRKSNTRVVRERNCELADVYLHDNHIATVGSRTGSIVYATLAGWDTNTTRSRLRALGVDVPALREREGYILPRKRRERRPRVEDFDI